VFGVPGNTVDYDDRAIRRGWLERAVLDRAVRLRAVPVRDGDFADPRRYCPRDRLALSWAAPAGAFRFGAYIPPLGPVPGPATARVNGVVICRGATYAYLGFEARWTTGGWQVVDVPALDEPAHEPASGRPSGPHAAVPLAAWLPPVGVAGFQQIVLASFPNTPSYDISRAYRAADGWRPYVGANPHTDHAHFSFSWAGARKQTSYWDGSPVTYGITT
jgi:hypothetical protein